jgi:hypothetical protein
MFTRRDMLKCSLVSAVAVGAPLDSFSLTQPEADSSAGTTLTALQETIIFSVVRYETDLGNRLYAGSPGQFYFAALKCYGEHHEQLNIVFPTLDSTPWQNSGPGGSQAFGVLCASLDQYVWYLDALRNEKCFVYMYPQHPADNRLWFGSVSSWGHTEN